MELLRLKELLKEQNLTGKEFSDMIGVTQTTVSSIVQGNSFPKPELLLKIAEVLNVDVRELFNPTKENSTQDLFIRNENGEFVKVGQLKTQL